jgi:hypothetical protein
MQRQKWQGIWRDKNRNSAALFHLDGGVRRYCYMARKPVDSIYE